MAERLFEHTTGQGKEENDSNEEIEAKTFIGLAEVRLAQGKLSDAIKYAEQSIQINSNKVRPKIILAIAKTRIGEGEEGIKILNELYDNRKDAEVALAISDYYSSFDDSKHCLLYTSPSPRD